VKSSPDPADDPDMGEAAPDARLAHRWAADVRALHAAIRQAKADGRLSCALGAPEQITVTFDSLLDAVDRLPDVGAIDTLAGLSRAQLGAWTHFFRVVRAWSNDLVQHGAIDYQPCPDAAQFESWLLAQYPPPQLAELPHR
jgi:hypothetical protein